MRVKFGGSLWLAGSATPNDKDNPDTTGYQTGVARAQQLTEVLRGTAPQRYDRKNYRQTFSFRAAHAFSTTAAGEKAINQHVRDCILAGKDIATFYYDDNTSATSANALVTVRTAQSVGALAEFEYTIEGDLITTAA